MELAVGEIYEGKVTGITKFGAFVVLDSGKSGLVHISEVANTFVSDVSAHVQMGQKIKVKVLSITEGGKINLSIKQVPQEAPADSQEKPKETALKRFNAPAKHEKYVMAPVQTVNEDSGNIDFEDRLKKFMQDSDSRIADSRMYERKSRNRRR